METPDPLQIANELREQLAQLRALVEATQDSSEYAFAADLLVRALRQLDKRAAAPAR